MRKPTKTAKPAAVATVADSIETVSLPAPVAVETVTVAVPDPVAVAADRRVARDAASVARFATHFGETSIRDDAYLALYALACVRSGKPEFTMRDVYDAGTDVGGKRRNPFYTGSSKATDVGAFNRARHAGNIVPTDASCVAFTFTERGFVLARAALAKLAKPGTAAADAIATVQRIAG